MAAALKVRGWTVHRSWPPFRRATPATRNLQLEDLLALQRARSVDFTALVVGAFDGDTNDPTAHFIQQHASRAVFVEPQPGPASLLRERISDPARFSVVQAAVDRRVGTRTLYVVRQDVGGLPAWTEQIASFDIEHLRKHAVDVPRITDAIEAVPISTVTFESLLDDEAVQHLDLLQLDAEGFDAQLLAWFPWHRLRPGLVHYEVVHMASIDREQLGARFESMGYRVFPGEGDTDDMAVLL
ncbi:MAG: FkbM family methyltransferase [Planctomycetes bacterium]|nr:FkbM family methyltransferase [Planctomycetota bacterium]